MMKRLILAATVLSIAVTGSVAGQAPRQNPSASSSQVTFHKEVLPILQRSCQNCHRPGQIGPMPLLTYQQARPWSRSSRRR